MNRDRNDPRRDSLPSFESLPSSGAISIAEKMILGTIPQRIALLRPSLKGTSRTVDRPIQQTQIERMTCIRTDNAKREPHRDIFSAEPIPDNSLIFINPPWDSPTVEKFVTMAYRRVLENPSVQVVFLLPNKLTEVRWVGGINDAFNHLIFLGGRVDFSGPHSVKGGASRWGCFLGWIGKGPTSMDSIRIKFLKEAIE